MTHEEHTSALFRHGPMIERVMRWLRDFRDGSRILRSRSFWRDFGEYWSGPAIAARMDEWTHAVRENLRMTPDAEVEERRERRQRERTH